MPFGEELYADGANRTSANKYSTTNLDSVRQRFTGYQKDTETQLDFAEARYYNNQHARFTAVDPLLASGKSANPQTFNRFVYCLNNPLILTDPSGLQAGFWAHRKKIDKSTGEEIGTTTTFFNSVAEMDQNNKTAADLSDTEFGKSLSYSYSAYQPWTLGDFLIFTDMTGVKLGADGTKTPFSLFGFSAEEVGQMSADMYAGKNFDQLTINRLEVAFYDSTKETNGLVNGLLAFSKTNNYYFGGKYDEKYETSEIKQMLGNPVGQAATLQLGFSAGSTGRVFGPRPRFGVFHSMYGDGTYVLEGQQPARLSLIAPAEANGAVTALRWDTVNGRIYQGRTFNASGRAVLDIDFTVPTYPNGTVRPNHFFGEIHPFTPNSSGGMSRGTAWSRYRTQ